MSGGLDSSAVAAMMVGQGCEVLGLTLHMFKEGSRCCSLEDVERAREICSFLGIRHYVVNAVDAFHDCIIKPFVDEYARGRTPSPCILCNEHIKFGTLMHRARQLGCTHVATGHYARITRDENGWHLRTGRDGAKDQSYFLHRLSQAQLARSLFPLASWTKDAVAAYVRESGIPFKKRLDAESQDLCFVSNAGHAPFVERYHPELRRTGPIVDTEGRELGAHEGYHRFTVGQRGGLGIAAGTRMYVKDMDPATNTVVVAPRDGVLRDACLVERVHWIAGHPPPEGATCSARPRYRHPGAKATLRLRDAGASVLLQFDRPQFALAPGQAAVIYDDDEILGGGWIASHHNRTDES